MRDLLAREPVVTRGAVTLALAIGYLVLNGSDIDIDQAWAWADEAVLIGSQFLLPFMSRQKVSPVHRP